MVARLFFVGEQKGNQSTSKWRNPINFKVKMKHFEMIFAIKNAIFSNKFSCNHYFLLLKVIFMQEWSFYALNTNTNFYRTEKRKQQRESISIARHEAGQTAEITVDV